MDTPFADAMAAVARRGPRFFVPGHKGSAAALPYLAGAAALDLTEVEGACDLSRPAGALAQSQTNMARVYGAAATLYCAAGSTACVQAMLALFVGAGGRVVMARGAHVAAVRALAFLDAEPVWVPPRGGRPRAEDIDRALGEGGCAAVYVTSPDYYGRMADIGAIAAVCARRGVPLLTDGAQGAHLKFLRAEDPAKSLHPLEYGAAAVCDSAHKTLPCLTPAAMLHLADGGLAQGAREALNLFSSTSPSYLALQSLDAAAGLLSGGAPPDFEAAARRVAAFVRRFPALCEPCDDPLRWLAVPARAGLDPSGFKDALLREGLAAEYFDGQCLVFMASPYNTEEDFAAAGEAVRRAAACLPRTARPRTPPVGADEFTERPPPRAVCSVRAALFGPRRRLPARAAAGRVMAGLDVPCPPGVPLVLPGEVIDGRAALLYEDSGIRELFVVE